MVLYSILFMRVSGSADECRRHDSRTHLRLRTTNCQATFTPVTSTREIMALSQTRENSMRHAFVAALAACFGPAFVHRVGAGGDDT